MPQILVTGATGQVGQAVLEALAREPGPHRLVAGVRDPARAGTRLGHLPGLALRAFDFEAPATYATALQGIDILFLLRPPHIADVQAVFAPLLQAAATAGIGQVMFLSVQGADKSPVIPHHKIERLIREQGFRYIFLRPSYFMQNLTSTLYPGIRDRQEIALPAGRGLFNWIDVQDIGAVAARLLRDFAAHAPLAIDLTGDENADFHTVTALIREVTGAPIHYRPLSPWAFYRRQRRAGMPRGQVIVMLLLHLLPRFQAAPRLSPAVAELTGQPPTSLRAFLARERAAFTGR